ncbi:prephenate dehydrogenase [Rothia mucilaginosa DY-18]|uniref:Prephenate dehydrogenase n=1 Tax=Rothia mucilaginosa (strain DY-18) TaxID=680646 RepID=D2NS70_ROTMD|nr:prephenate dehydrogenase [Rothia mucilaginosa DY-18]
MEVRVREEAEATASAVKAPCSWLDFATDNQVIPSPMNRFRLATGRSHQLGRNLIANATNRLNKTIRTQLIKLSAQTLDVHVYQRIAHISVTPDHIQQFLTAQRLARVAHQRSQQVKLQRSHRNLSAVVLDGTTVHIHDNIANGHHQLAALARTQTSTNTRQQFSVLKRLRNVIISTSLKTLNNIFSVAFSGQHNNRHIRRAANLLAHFNTVHARKHQIQKHQIGSGTHKSFKSACTIFTENSVKALLREHEANHFRQSIIVINHQNGVCIACAHSTSLKNCRKYLHKNADYLIIPRTQPMHGHTLSHEPAKPWHPAHSPYPKPPQQTRNRPEYAHQASNPPRSAEQIQDQPHATGCTDGAPDQEPVQKSPPAATAEPEPPKAAPQVPRNEDRSAEEPAACPDPSTGHGQDATAKHRERHPRPA